MPNFPQKAKKDTSHPPSWYKDIIHGITMMTKIEHV